MDLKVFLNTFMVIFIAEIFDKTELAIFSFSLRNQGRFSIFLGAMIAFLISTILALVLGSFISHIISAKFIRYISSGIFLITSILIFIGKI